MKALIKLFLLPVLLFSGCNKENITEPNSELFGFYESSTFVEPGSTDGGIDIQSAGGYLNITFNNDFNFSAEMFVPNNVSSNYPAGQTTFEGGYSIEDNIVKFNASFIVDKLRWEKGKKALESMEAPLRGQPFEIILRKTNY